MSRESMGEALTRIVSEEGFAEKVSDNASALDSFELDADEREALTADATALGGDVSGFQGKVDINSADYKLRSEDMLGSGFMVNLRQMNGPFQSRTEKKKK